jgi:hypothetical protein
MVPLTNAQILIRPAYADDQPALGRLAALDSAPAAPSHPLLVAEVEGELKAALSLDDQSSIADPFYPSAPLVALLRAHAAGAAGAAGLSPRARRRRRRLQLSLARG